MIELLHTIVPGIIGWFGGVSGMHFDIATKEIAASGPPSKSAVR